MNPWLKSLAEHLEERLKEKLVAQGHTASRSLLNSIRVRVNETVQGWKIVGANLEYGQYVDTGTKPGRYVPIRALIDWIRYKNINLRGRKEQDVAYAIRQAIFKNGTPTKGEGNKKHWIRGTLKEEEGYIKEEIQEAIYVEVSLMFKNMIDNSSKELNLN